MEQASIIASSWAQLSRLGIVMNRTGASQTKHVNPLMTRPATAYALDVSLITPIIPKSSASGGVTIVRIPTRNPSDDPQPKLNTPAIVHRKSIHGVIARNKLILPSFILEG